MERIESDPSERPVEAGVTEGEHDPTAVQAALAKVAVLGSVLAVQTPFVSGTTVRASVDRARGYHPLVRLASDFGDEIEVGVVVENRDRKFLSGSCDE
jgi:hypothetical protein